MRRSVVHWCPDHAGFIGAAVGRACAMPVIILLSWARANWSCTVTLCLLSTLLVGGNIPTFFFLFWMGPFSLWMDPGWKEGERESVCVCVCTGGRPKRRRGTRKV